MKPCIKCGEEKPETDEFFRPYRNKKDEPRHKSICRACTAKDAREYTKVNKPWLRPHKQAYQKKYQEDRKKPRVYKTYGKTRECIKCGEEKPNTDEHFRPFKNKTGESRRYNSCRICESAYSVQYAKDVQQHKKPHVRAYQKKYGETHKEKIRNAFYVRTYGITWEEVKAMAEKQNNGCAICQAPPDWDNRR